MLTKEQIEQFKELLETLPDDKIIEVLFDAGYQQAIDDLNGYETTGIGAY